MVAMTGLVTIADIDAAATRIERSDPTDAAAGQRDRGRCRAALPQGRVAPAGRIVQDPRGAQRREPTVATSSGRRGIVTHSSGNHAQAVARAARSFGLACTVVMPRNTPDVKRAATQALGATVVLVEPHEREATAAQISAETGAVLVPPYDDPAVIAGQGTVGAEIAADLAAMDVDSVDTVYVPVSGGGLVSGVAVAVKARLRGRSGRGRRARRWPPISRRAGPAASESSGTRRSRRGRSPTACEWPEWAS